MKKFADVLHKTAVTALMVLTGVSSIALVYQVSAMISMARESKRLKNAVSIKESTDSLVSMVMFLCSKLSSFFQLLSPPILTRSVATATGEKTWKVLKANHVAVATTNLEKSVKLYRDILGIKTSEAVPQPEHGVTTVFVDLSNTKLELLLPFGEKSPIANFLEKNASGGMHHICLEVDNIKNAVKDLKDNNIRLLSEEPKIGAHGKPVIFLHPKDCAGVLIELEQV